MLSSEASLFFSPHIPRALSTPPTSPASLPRPIFGTADPVFLLTSTSPSLKYGLRVPARRALSPVQALYGRLTSKSLQSNGTFQRSSQQAAEEAGEERAFFDTLEDGSGSEELQESEAGGEVLLQDDVPSSVAKTEVTCRIETVAWRQRHISACMCIETDLERVWEVLTQYEQLADFIPNLALSERIPSPDPTRIWLLQLGVQSSMYWQIEARVVLELTEKPDASGGPELQFNMVEGDFKLFAGKWSLRQGMRPHTTMLHYEVDVQPRALLPTHFVERIIQNDLPRNLRAIALRALQGPSFLPKARTASTPSVAPGEDFPAALPAALVQVAPGNGPPWLPIKIPSAEPPLPDPPTPSFPLCVNAPGKGTVRMTDAAYVISCPPVHEEDSRRGLVREKVQEGGRELLADEVHLRRLDDLLENGGVHRRVVAAITIAAGAEEVYGVLTDYERLPEFIPNLASSKVLNIQPRMHRVRLLQVGVKCLMYMVLHARVILDIQERPAKEILFRQVEGDFERFHGKWVLEPLGNTRTLLRYVAETRMKKNSLLPEALVEEVIYEDLPANLAAIRDRIESLLAPSTVPKRSSTGDRAASPSALVGAGMAPGAKRRRTPVAGLRSDFAVLERELRGFVHEFGREGFMPVREELRRRGRVDLEKAIRLAGGFADVAAKMGLKMAYKVRKPKGYWSNLANVRAELEQFFEEQGRESGVMPPRHVLENAGRYDLARAMEKWGGLMEVARLLDWRSSRAKPSTEDVNYESDDERYL